MSDGPASADPVRVVVMGVSGSGKTTVGNVLAERLGARFVEADGLHPASNVDKMSAGTPLTDDDRWPWLDRIADELADTPVVATCSALRRAYRDVLRRRGDTTFVLLDIDRETAIDRLRSRADHFMGPEMVDSQFETLEPPHPDEDDVVRVDAAGALDEVLDEVLGATQRAIACARPDITP